MRVVSSQLCESIRVRSARVGFTLIEVLIVVTLLALAATIASIRFAPSLRKARVDAAVEHWRRTDLLARQTSRLGNVTLHVESDRAGSLITVRPMAGDIVCRWRVESPIQIRLENAAGKAIDQLEFPFGAGSIDYRVVVSEGPVKRRLEVAGGTGSARESLVNLIQER